MTWRKAIFWAVYLPCLVPLVVMFVIGFTADAIDHRFDALHVWAYGVPR